MVTKAFAHISQYQSFIQTVKIVNNRVLGPFLTVALVVAETVVPVRTSMYTVSSSRFSSL